LRSNYDPLRANRFCPRPTAAGTGAVIFARITKIAGLGTVNRAMIEPIAAVGSFTYGSKRRRQVWLDQDFFCLIYRQSAADCTTAVTAIC
jgi:hypothetical protein